MLKIAIFVVHVIACLVLIASILMQSGKSAGLSGAIAGGAETFFGKNKSKTMDALFSRITKISAFLFIITSLILTYILNVLNI